MKYRCSKCKEIFEGTPNYCPHCGTKLKWPTSTNTEPKVETKVDAPIVNERKNELPVSETPKQEVVNKKDYSKTYNLIALIAAGVGLLMFILLFFTHVFVTELHTDSGTYPIGFGYLDFLVYVIYNWTHGSFYLPYIGLFGMGAALVGLCMFIYYFIKELINLIKKKTIREQRIWSVSFKKDPVHICYLSIIFLIMIIIFSKIQIGIYVGTGLFKDFNIGLLVVIFISEVFLSEFVFLFFKLFFTD